VPIESLQKIFEEHSKPITRVHDLDMTHSRRQSVESSISMARASRIDSAEYHQRDDFWL